MHPIRAAGIIAVVTSLTCGGIAASAAGHSEPLLRLAGIEGIAEVVVSPPPRPGRPRLGHPYPVRGIKVMVTNTQGGIVATTTTSSNGLFKFRVRAGSYNVAARVGPPSATPGHGCGKPLGVKLTRRQHVRIRLVCNLR
jgi:hypothetical protein